MGQRAHRRSVATRPPSLSAFLQVSLATLYFVQAFSAGLTCRTSAPLSAARRLRRADGEQSAAHPT